MAPDPTDAANAKKAPEAFKAWGSLRGTLNVAVPASLRNARAITRATKRGRPRGR